MLRKVTLNAKKLFYKLKSDTVNVHGASDNVADF